MQGLRRSKLVTIELEMLEMGRCFILWVPSQEEPCLLSGIDTGFLLCRPPCPPFMWSHFSVSLKEALRAGHRWNMVCPAQQLPRKLCRQDHQCEKAQGDHLLPWGYVKHHGQGEPASLARTYCLGWGFLCHLSDRSVGKGKALALTLRLSLSEWVLPFLNVTDFQIIFL